jgi:hypothetical protein
MRSVFWAELRRSPLRWWLPVLALLNVVVLASNQGWAGAWPRASAEALRPVVFLGPLVAAGAAWSAARSGLPGVSDRMRSSARADWIPDAAQLTGSAVIGLVGYLAGVAYAAFASFAQAGPGFIWPSYLLLGAAATVACAAIGHIAGRVTGSRFGAPIAAGAGCLVLMMAFSSLLGLTDNGNAVVGDPAFSVKPAALDTRLLLGLGLTATAVTVPSLLGWKAGRWQPELQRWSAGALGVAVVVAAVALIPTQQVLQARAAPTAPDCTATVPRMCLWPEDRSYLKDVTALAVRAGQLPPDQFRVPGTFYEQGVGVGDSSGFSLDYGSVSDNMWFVASAMAYDVLSSTFGSQACFPPSMSKVSYDNLEQSSLLLVQWLSTRIFGGPQPSTVFGGPPGVDPIAIGRLAKEPEAAQAAFVRTQATVKAKYVCKAYAKR